MGPDTKCIFSKTVNNTLKDYIRPECVGISQRGNKLYFFSVEQEEVSLLQLTLSDSTDTLEHKTIITLPMPKMPSSNACLGSVMLVEKSSQAVTIDNE